MPAGPIRNPEMRAPPSDAIKAAAADWIARRDAGLSRSESAEMQAWVDADPRHRQALERCGAAWGALDHPYQAGAGNDFLEAIEARVRRRRRRQLASATTGLVVLLGIGIGWRWASQPPSSAPIESVRPGTATVVLPSQRTLPDGSRVELNEGAEITTDFRGDRRRVELRKGEAYFVVARDPTRPFIVATGRFDARAVGTAFAVRRAASSVDVLVTEGQVAVERRGEDTTGTELPAFRVPIAAAQTVATLRAGDRAVMLTASGGDVRPEIASLPAEEIRERLAWRAPRFEFTRTPLAEAVALLNEQAVRAAAAGQAVPRYVVDDPEIASMRVSGLFRVDNTDSFVRLMKHGFGIEAEQREGSGEILLRKAR